MIRRFLALAIVLAAATGTASAQSAPDLSFLPTPCRAGITEDLPALEKRQKKLERQLRSTRLPKTLRQRREELVQVMFAIECLRSIERDEVVEVLAERKAPQRRGAKPSTLAEVTTYYATNRAASGSAEPSKAYISTVAPLTYGRTVVTIPSTHKPGNLELPTIFKLELQSDPAKHFILKAVIPLQLDAARAEMADRLKVSDSKALLVFVHGYNVDFSEAALRTAQLAYDLRFGGVPLFFSWPSAAETLAYMQDVETARLSEAVFDQFLDDVSKLPTKDIYIVAHSMGSRIVGNALKSRLDRGKSATRLSALLLGAPDINAELFRTEIAPTLAAMQDTRTTVYTSSSDLALRASRIIQGYKRVGETTGGVAVYSGLETVDASGAALITRAFGHSYLMDSVAVLKDIQAILSQRLSAKQRGLAAVGAPPNLYWKLQ